MTQAQPPGADAGVAAAGSVRMPSRRLGPLAQVGVRAGLAFALMLLTTLIVWLQRNGYHDNAHPGRPLGALAAAYYSAVTLSTTGYGDIVPVSQSARLLNLFVLTPIRVAFLIILIGTTLEALAARSRANFRISRWRSRLPAGHTVLVGYGTKGRSALSALRAAGADPASLVIVDMSPSALEEANQAGLVAVSGDATSRGVLARAQIGRAGRLIVAVGRDDTAVLVTLTARELNPGMVVVAAARESENEPLLRQSGADHVVVSAESSGRALGLYTIEPGASAVMAGLAGRGLGMVEVAAGPDEVGRPAAGALPGTIAVVRGGVALALDDERAGLVEPGDRLVLVSARPAGSQR